VRQTWLAVTLILMALLQTGCGSSANELEIVPTGISPRDGAEMVLVPAGEFIMGSEEGDPDAYDCERPQHSVYLDAYWIDRTEVTNARFARFVEATLYETDAEKAGHGDVYDPHWKSSQWEFSVDWAHPRDRLIGISEIEDHPVVQVSWNDAAAYCEWAGKRLPTEAEWEKAARGADGRKYPWGDADPNEHLSNIGGVHATDDGYQFTAPVGSYPNGASPYGVLDMAGNVWEWVADWH